MEVKEKSVFVNPYVIQMDKFADSMVHLSNRFLALEGYKGAISETEKRELFDKVTDKVCERCEKKEECLGKLREETYERVITILKTVEEYGAELNMEIKKELKKNCLRAPRFLREILELYEQEKKILVWNNKMVRNRESYVGQLENFAKLIQYTTRELDAGIFEDDFLEKKIKIHLKRMGVKLLSSVFYVTEQGKYEVHLTVKTKKGICVATKELAHEVGACLGRVMMPEQGEQPIISPNYCTIACVEGAKFQTIQGVAKIGKKYDQISGDTFLITDIPGGKKAIALSDGMGSGKEALQESSMIVEMLEELLEAGFPIKTAIEIMNTALIIGREEVKFSTIDVSLFDLYTGECEFVKAGAATTFLKQGEKVEQIHSSTLPIGVIRTLDLETITKQLHSGDFVIMVTDGIMDALPIQEQDALMEQFIREIKSVNPNEFAQTLLGRVLEWSGEKPTDDMTVIVIGFWKL